MKNSNMFPWGTLFFLCFWWNIYQSTLVPQTLHQKHSEFWHVQYSVFSSICLHIESYSALLRHIHTYWGIVKALWLIQAYSAPCVILTYSQPCHILRPDIFGTGGLGCSLLIRCSLSDACMLLFNPSFSTCKLITDWKVHKLL